MTVKTKKADSEKRGPGPKGKPHHKPHPEPDHKKPRAGRSVAALTAKADQLLRHLLPEPSAHQWAFSQVTSEGPDHKQLHAALLLDSMSRLVDAISTHSETKFELKPTEKVSMKKNGGTLPVDLFIPPDAIGSADQKDILETLSHAPEHEQVLFAALLQSMDWGINALKK